MSQQEEEMSEEWLSQSMCVLIWTTYNQCEEDLFLLILKEKKLILLAYWQNKNKNMTPRPKNNIRDLHNALKLSYFNTFTRCHSASVAELRNNVAMEHEQVKQKDHVPKASYGYGGKFGVEKDRMDKV